MPKYPKRSLEDKLVWMRERQKEKEEAAADQQQESMAKQAAEQQVAAPPVPEHRMIPPRHKMMRVGEVAEILGVSISTVLRWFRDRAVVVRGPRKTTMLISEQILDEWIAEHTAQPRRRR